MTATVTNSFVTRWEKDVFHDYQLMGSQLRSSVRSRFVDSAESLNFHRLGTGVAQQKGRHGKIQRMNLQHQLASLNVVDWYAAEELDDLDRFKTDPDFRNDYKMAAVQALGRKEDEIIITTLSDSVAASGAPNSFTVPAAVAFSDVLEIIARADEANIPKGGQRALISVEFHMQLLQLDEFTNADYVTNKQIPGAPQQFDWLGLNWTVYNGLPLSVTDVRSCYMIDRDNTVMGINKDITMNIDRLPESDSYLVAGKLSMGATTIREDSVFEWLLDES